MADKRQSVLNETKYELSDTFGEQDLISLSLIKYGEWETNESFTTSKFLKKADIVLDVGIDWPVNDLNLLISNKVFQSSKLN